MMPITYPTNRLHFLNISKVIVVHIYPRALARIARCPWAVDQPLLLNITFTSESLIWSP
jgi:hypothetical protein